MVSLDITKAAISTIKRLFEMDEVTRMASVETCVVVTTLLLVIRFLLDFLGPWYRTWSFLPLLIPTIEGLNYSMVHYTMGLMQLTAARVNDYFQVWAVLLVTLQYSVKVGRPYSRSKQIPLLDLMSSFWAANLLRMQTTFLLRIPLWLIWALNAARIISYFSSSDKASAINQESMRIVADYMSYEHALAGSRLSGDIADPLGNGFTMDSYNYLVNGEDQVAKDLLEGLIPVQAQQEHSQRRRKRQIRLDPGVHKNLVTVNKIWNVEGGDSRLLGGTADPANQLKDVCLSFALYKLLRRLFYDLPIHETRLPRQGEKIRRLMFRYILQDAERAFRVVATELSFLQDFFYSKRAAAFATGFPAKKLVLSLLLVAATGYIVYPVRNIPKTIDKEDHNTITHGVFITRLIISLIIGKELAEIYMYFFSQWTKVLVLCNYAKHRCLRHPLMETVLRAVLFFMTRHRWDEKIRQHNILISARSWVRKPIFAWGLPIKFPVSIKLEACTKEAIFESIKRLEKNPERLGSYFSNAFGEQDQHLHRKLLWAVELEADTHRIIVWHIATCLCEIDLASDKAAALRPSFMSPRPFVKKPKGSEPGRPSSATAKRSTGSVETALWWEHYATAASLSNYCAYLGVQALVPDNGLVNLKVLHEVLWEIINVTFDGRTGLFKLRSMRDVFSCLMRTVNMPGEKEALDKPDEEEAVPPPEPTEKQSVNRNGDVRDINNSLTSMGAKLAKQLMEEYKDDKAGLWEKLAAFWTGFLLHLAASTRTSKHRTHLTGSPELTTHLWALLCHAGFLGRTSHGQTVLDPHDLSYDPETRSFAV